MNCEFKEAVERFIRQVVDSNNTVYVKKSWIDSAEQGLFCRRFVSKGKIIGNS